MKDVIIIGTGGHAKVVADIILSSGDNIVGFFSANENENSFLGKEILGGGRPPIGTIRAAAS